MLAFLLNLLNPIGKAIDLASAFLTKKQDVDLEKYKVKGQVDIKSMETDLAIIQARANLAAALKDDPASVWGRRLLIYPTGVWYSLIVWDSIARENPVLSGLRWEVLALPNALSYIPYAVVAFLLVTSFKK